MVVDEAKAKEKYTHNLANAKHIKAEGIANANQIIINYWNDLDSLVDLYIIADWLLDDEEKIKELDIIDNDNGGDNK